MGYLQTWCEYFTGKVRGEQGIWEILPGLFQSTEIRKPDVIKAHDIRVVIDLEGNFDESALSGFLKAYLWWPIEDKAELPDLEELKEIATHAWWWHNEGNKVLIH